MPEELKRFPLTFDEFRHANSARAIVWHNGNKPTVTFALLELFGEIGEAQQAVCDALKKVLRHEANMAGGSLVFDKSAAADELADMVITIDRLSDVLGIDLGEAVRAKFNKTSAKHNFPHTL